MRLTHLNGLTLLASAVILTACAGGGENNNAGATSGATGSAAVTATPPGGQPAGGAGGAQAATGQTHTVRMVGDAQGYRFEPANITVKQGDAVKWVMVSGGPHNVASLTPDIAGTYVIRSETIGAQCPARETTITTTID